MSKKKLRIKTYTVTSSYKLHYLKQNIPNPVTLQVFMSIAIGFMKFMVKKVLQGNFIELSGGNSMGVLGIIGKKRELTFDDKGHTRNHVNWAITKKLWQDNPEAKKNKTLIFFTNEHSNSIVYTFVWRQKGMLVGNKILYSLKVVRSLNRAMAKEIIDNKREYIVKHYIKY